MERKEEEFMYKYLSQIEKKKKLEIDSDAEVDSDADSDPEMEAFAEQEIKKEMKRLNGEVGSDEEEEALDVSYSEGSDKQSEQDSNQDGQAGNVSESEEDFFSDQDDLEEVVDSEQEMSDDSNNGIVDDPGSDYGQEYDEEIEEQEEAETSKKKKKVKGDDAGFASYEDFAHLLEEGVEEDKKQSKEKGFLKKRTFNEFNAAAHRFTKKAGSEPSYEAK